MGLNILIVDDSPAMRTFIRRVIELSGFEVGEVFEVGDGHEALQKLQDHKVDLVLTDVNLPVLNGEELVRRMAADEALRRIPVVVVSTESNKARIDRLVSLGARSHVRKPFLPETLRDELKWIFGP